MYDIDIIQVGEESRAGDAICFRYSDDGTNWKVGIVDGGDKDAGEKLSKHIEKYYETKTVDFVISTHPDQDHVSGLEVVLQKLNVQKLFMNCPWEYADQLIDDVEDDRRTEDGLRSKLEDSFTQAFKVYTEAERQGIPISPIFAGLAIDPGFVTVMGPSKVRYLELLKQFRALSEVPMTESSNFIAKAGSGIATAVKALVKWIKTTWETELLEEPSPGDTSAENETSVVTLLSVDKKPILLTGDVGIIGLEDAANELESNGIPLQNFEIFQIPHHGSKRNVGPAILNRMIGPILAENSEATFRVFVSAPKQGAPKHPNKKVINAFTRRGGKVFTPGGILHFYDGTSDRGWRRATPHSFYSQIEDEELSE